MQSKQHLDRLHSEHHEWKAQLMLSLDETDVLQRRLDETVQRNNDRELMVSVEQLQNRLTHQCTLVEEYLGGIKAHEKEIAAAAMSAPTAADHLLVHDHPEERDRMEQFAKLFNELKRDIYRTIGPWL
jgi:DNA repair protein RadC